MKKELEQFLFHWSTPIISDRDIYCFFEKYSRKVQKDLISRAIAWGWLHRIKKGLYFIGPPFRADKPSRFEIAQHIYGPSYISMESALSYHGMIPEAVYATVSACTLRSKEFDTPLGLFLFHHVPVTHFYEGVERLHEGQSVCLMATALKAVGDYIYVHKKEYASPAAMAQDLRMELDLLCDQPVELLRLLRNTYPCKRVKRFYTLLLEDVLHEH